MIEPNIPHTDTAFELVINGRFLSQRMTGVQRVAREFVLALDRRMSAGLYPGLRVRLVAPQDAAFDADDLQAIAVQRVGGGRGHLWEQFALPYYVGGAALLCLGNSAPIVSLLGRQPVAVMVHDLAYRLFPGDYSLPYRLLHRAIDLVLIRRARPLVTVSAAERAVIGTAASGGRAAHPGRRKRRLPQRCATAARLGTASWYRGLWPLRRIALRAEERTWDRRRGDRSGSEHRYRLQARRPARRADPGHSGGCPRADPVLRLCR